MTGRAASEPSRIWAVLPAKAFARAKSRLRAKLDDEQRAALAQSMFEHVLAVLLRTPEISAVLVITDGDDVAALATRAGAHVVRDPVQAEGTLAGVVDAALAELQARGATAALVLMADLPRIDVPDVQELLQACNGVDLLLSPDHGGRSTNALGIRLDRRFQTSFGQPDSFARHELHARELGLQLRVMLNPRVAFDVDTPDQLQETALS